MCDITFMKKTLLPRLDLDDYSSVLAKASCYGILLESELFIFLCSRLSISSIILSEMDSWTRDLYERVLACLVGLAVHFRCIYHTSAFLATYQYQGQETVHQKYSASVNQLVSISMMGQAFSALIDSSDSSKLPYLTMFYDVISNDFYQPQCRDHNDILSREERMFQRILTAVDGCLAILRGIPET